LARFRHPTGDVRWWREWRRFRPIARARGRRHGAARKGTGGGGSCPEREAGSNLKLEYVDTNQWIGNGPQKENHNHALVHCAQHKATNQSNNVTLRRRQALLDSEHKKLMLTTRTWLRRQALAHTRTLQNARLITTIVKEAAGSLVFCCGGGRLAVSTHKAKGCPAFLTRRQALASTHMQHYQHAVGDASGVAPRPPYNDVDGARVFAFFA
jgi:hypothetical protein